MARADLLCELIKSGLNGDEENFRRVVEAVYAEEKALQHGILAGQIRKLLDSPSRLAPRQGSVSTSTGGDLLSVTVNLQEVTQ